VTPQSAFKTAWGIKMHFASMSYSVLKYGTNTKAASAKYAKLTPNQKFRYEWLANRFPSTQDLVYACIGCEFADVDIHYGIKDDIINAYIEFKSRREGMTYRLQKDRNLHESYGLFDTQKVFFKHLICEFSPEYVIILTRGTNQLMDFYNSPTLSWAKDKTLKLIKYQDFFNSTKYLHIIQDHESAIIA
jgi:hypothetical protein